MTRAWPVPPIRVDGPVAPSARHILAVRIGEYYSHGPAVPFADAVEPLHDMRISAKRLRYTLELFRDVFGETGKAQIDRVKAIQEALGNLHDHDVRIALVEDELAGLLPGRGVDLFEVFADSSEAELLDRVVRAESFASDDPRRGLIALLARERIGRKRAYLSFRERWDRFEREGFRADLVRLSAMPLDEG